MRRGLRCRICGKGRGRDRGQFRGWGEEPGGIREEEAVMRRGNAKEEVSRLMRLQLGGRGSVRGRPRLNPGSEPNVEDIIYATPSVWRRTLLAYYRTFW